MARVADVEWQVVGLELEALLREAEWIRDFAPVANVQVGAPSADGRAIPPSAFRNLVVVVPSTEERSVELVAAHTDGATMIQRTARDGRDLAAHTPQLWMFFNARGAARVGGGTLPVAERGQSPIVFSWLAGRGAAATRVEIETLGSPRALHGWLEAALGARELFTERLILRPD